MSTGTDPSESPYARRKFDWSPPIAPFKEGATCPSCGLMGGRWRYGLFSGYVFEPCKNAWHSRE